MNDPCVLTAIRMCDAWHLTRAMMTVKAAAPSARRRQQLCRSINEDLESTDLSTSQ